MRLAHTIAPGDFTRRLLLAAVLAVLAHLIALPFFPFRPHAQVVARVRAVPIRLIVVKPTPRPKHKPRHRIHVARHVPPRIHRHVVHIARSREGAGTRGAVRPHKTHRVAKAPPRRTMRHELVRRTAAPVAVASSRPADAPVADEGADGASHDGPAVSGGGTGGTAQSGAGAGAAGTGAGEGSIPCGVPKLDSLRTSVVNGVTLHVMRATANYPDGHTETAEFPYPFRYGPGEVDPFTSANRNNPNVLILVQFPPAGFDRTTLPPVIRTILSRTSSEGISLFLPCEGQSGP